MKVPSRAGHFNFRAETELAECQKIANFKLTSLCFISNTVNEGLVSHFQNSIVVA